METDPEKFSNMPEFTKVGCELRNFPSTDIVQSIVDVLHSPFVAAGWTLEGRIVRQNLQVYCILAIFDAIPKVLDMIFWTMPVQYSYMGKIFLKMYSLVPSPEILV